MAIVTLVTGGNIGNRYDSLSEAQRAVEERIGDVLVSSSYYESEPWGFDSDLPFINQALIVSTKLSPYEVLEEIKRIEIAVGRTSKSSNGVYTDRIVDIDIIFYDNLVMFDDPELIIPHPHMHKRRFVLEPLNEIASKLVHPTKRISVEALLHACIDTNKVYSARSI
ncbi:2-amino-4-hydroxy-6-hydroxymethyldihydropteridine diphosphokinase [Saccharicrinis sp. FJH54]|uniref:2-amino-4-hydroxy-6- hydroxymethyldihydropteridine diphosphokinase n=1 Tax=Saccharicrinis sp. FJH54 TaxID=3344665 RepID=UPI0035D4399F